VKFRKLHIEELPLDPSHVAPLASGKTATAEAVAYVQRYHLTEQEPQLIALLNSHETPKNLLVPVLQTLASFPSMAEDTFATLAADPSAPDDARQAAIAALEAIGSDSARARIKAIEQTR
jgi:hypothetical protein